MKLVTWAKWEGHWFALPLQRSAKSLSGTPITSSLDSRAAHVDSLA